MTDRAEEIAIAVALKYLGSADAHKAKRLLLTDLVATALRAYAKELSSPPDDGKDYGMDQH